MKVVLRGGKLLTVFRGISVDGHIYNTSFFDESRIKCFGSTDFSSDLKFVGIARELDITKVYMPTTYRGLFETDLTDMELIWEREIKKISIEDAMKLLKQYLGEDVEIIGFGKIGGYHE
jgi:hypothetical protein